MLPFFSASALPTSYCAPSTSNVSTTSPRRCPLDNSLSPLMLPNPNRANSIAISMVDLPDPTSPDSSTYPEGNSRRSLS